MLSLGYVVAALEFCFHIGARIIYSSKYIGCLQVLGPTQLVTALQIMVCMAVGSAVRVTLFTIGFCWQIISLIGVAINIFYLLLY